MHSPSRSKGFTLIELMIVGVVVAVLATVAYPAYTKQIAKSRRTDAKSTLLICAQTLERYATQSGHYTAGTDPTVAAACVGTSKGGYYTLPSSNVPAASAATTFSVSAVPTGRQSTDGCGTFTYDSSGVKGVSSATQPSGNCW